MTWNPCKRSPSTRSSAGLSSSPRLCAGPVGVLCPAASRTWAPDPGEFTMLDTRRAIWLMSPSCRATGRIKVNHSHVRMMTRENGGGVMEMHVRAGEICPHKFDIHVDAHGKARSVHNYFSFSHVLECFNVHSW
ncbi:MAG: hypothetical protein ACFFCS_26495 [Candidatus Hodarchaeota archaeon]